MVALLTLAALETLKGRREGARRRALCPLTAGSGRAEDALGAGREEKAQPYPCGRPRRRAESLGPEEAARSPGGQGQASEPLGFK